MYQHQASGGLNQFSTLSAPCLIYICVYRHAITVTGILPSEKSTLDDKGSEAPIAFII